MQRKLFVLILSGLISGSLAHGQTGTVTPPPSVDQGVTPQSMDVATPDQVGDADPLDVLEPKKETTPVEPTVPQFTEIPESSPDVPPPTVQTEPATEVATPTAPPVTPKKKRKNKKSAEPVVINNDPDPRREARFHNIYKKYNEQPTSTEAWEKAAEARKSENYKVQKGDTLWALSNTFFADANCWPKIWSLNVGQISNPHEIDPNMNIQFFPGTMADAPTLGLVEKESTEIDDAPKLASNDNNIVPVASKRKKSPVLKNIPSSIPNYRYSKIAVPPTIIDFPSLIRPVRSSKEYMSYFVVDRFPDTIGTIVETEMGVHTATDFQYVIVKMEGSAEVRKKLVAIKELEKVKDPGTFFINAKLVEVQGEIEIIERVHDSKNLYRAIIQKSIAPVEVGALLMPGSMPSFDPGPTSVVSSANAVIIGGEFESKRKQYQSNMIVFINIGSSKGVTEGQSFPVYSNIRNRNQGSVARVNDRRVGIIKVIRVSENYATAYVTAAQDDIFVGDHIGARNSGSTSSDSDLDSNTDLSKSPNTDFVEPLDKGGSKDNTSTDNSDFEL